MFGINTQTQFIATPVAADVKARAAASLAEIRGEVVVKPVVNNYVKPVVINTPAFKTRGQAKLESVAKKQVVDVLIAEVRIKPKKTFWQKLFCVSQYN